MRIVLVNPYFGPVPGGLEKDVLQLANTLVHQGDVVAIVTTVYEFPAGRVNPSHPPTYELSPEVQIVRLEGRFRSRLRGFCPANPPLWLPGLARAVFQLEPDAVVFYNVGWPLTILPAMLALRRKTIVLYRTAYHAYDDSHRLDPLRRHLQLGVAGLSHRLVTYSHFEKTQIVEQGGVPAEKIVPVYPGVEVMHPIPEEVAAFRSTHDLIGKVVISHVARLSIFKGTDKLIQLLPVLRAETGQDVVLLLVGRNLEPDLLGSLVQECGVEQHVKFLGAVSEEELRLAYTVSDLFALPSQYESFGLVFLEAWAQGVPVIGCATGGVPELIHHGENGYLLEDAGQVAKLQQYAVQLIADENLRRQMGQKGQARVQAEFTWPQCARRFKELIQHLQEEQLALCKS